MKDSPTSTRRPLLIFGAILLIASLACDGCLSCGSDRDVQKVADQFPEDTEAMIVLSNPATIYDQLEALAEDDDTPEEIQSKIQDQLEELNEEFEENIGLAFDDPDAWEERGVKRDGRLIGGLVGEEFAFCLPVSDEEKFDEFMDDEFALEMARTSDELERDEDRDIDGHTIRVAPFEHETWDFDSGGLVDVDYEFVWGFVDDVACFLEDEVDNNPAEGLAQILEGPEGDTLNDNPHFEAFRDEVLADSFFSLYFQPDWEGAGGLNPLLGSAGDEDAEELNDAISALGMGLYYGDDKLRFRSWSAVGDDDLEWIEEASSSEHSVDWENFVTENTKAGLRTSFQPAMTWEQMQSTLDDEILEEVEELFSEIREGTDGAFDVEDDFIDNWSGQFGIFVYEAGDAEDMAFGGPDLENEFELLAVMQFVDDDELDALLEEMESVVEDAFFVSIERRALEESDGSEADDIDVIELVGGVKMYRADDLLVIASDAIGESGVASYIRGERSEAPLADADTALGAPFSSEEHFNGFYLTGEGAGFIMDMMGLPLDLETDQAPEVLATTVVTDSGAALDIEIYPGASMVGYFLETL